MDRVMIDLPQGELVQGSPQAIVASGPLCNFWRCELILLTIEKFSPGQDASRPVTPFRNDDLEPGTCSFMTGLPDRNAADR